VFLLKKIFSRKVLPVFFILVLVFIGIIKIDLINTQALSPLGNTNENYKLVSDEFGEDFSNFIKDNSFLKIYKEAGKEVLVRMGNSDFKINNESNFIKKIQLMFKNTQL
jgi:hypothetical protein